MDGNPSQTPVPVWLWGWLMDDRWQSNPQLDLVSDSPGEDITPERWQQIKNLFGAALECTPEERGAFLQKACGSDESLRAEVESLLTEQQAVTTSAAASATSVPQSALEAEVEDAMVGRRLGAHEIVRRIAIGGMATVYLAVRADAQYRKQVAIKLLTSGLDSPEIMRRFRNERQTLAALDHPNIVKLLDGGTTPEGVPYLVIDYVEGVSIDEYCDSHKLDISERLRLFRTVCAAVEYAHQKGAIHRDLKPSNMLVTAEGTCKLLDFGIAKVLNPELSAGTLQLTQSGERQLTPAYASPEQVRGEPVTCASDVYSLGVVLYELLTGHRPYRLKRHTPMELERVICDTDPERPSTAVNQIETETAPDGSMSSVITPESVSRTREGEPQKLRRRLRGDLDNILLMALQKKPQRRYASVEEFSADILRHLEQRPVKARKSTLAYRTSRFIRRHRMEVLAGLLFLVAGAIGLAGSARWGSSYFRRWFPETTIPAIHSLAVLPLQNLSGDPAQEYFADGITDELITQLSQNHDLRVISYSSTAAYKDSKKKIPAIGRELGVDALVEGSVKRAGNRVRVNAQLIYAPREEHLWGKSYERDLQDVLTLESTLATAIADEVDVRLTPAQQARFRDPRPVNLKAYEAYLQGNAHLAKLGILLSDAGAQIRTNADEAQKAIAYFQEAIREDPTFAAAYVKICEVYEFQAFLFSPADRWPAERAAAEKALSLDPNLPGAHLALGQVKMNYEWDLAAAHAEFVRAVELDPNNADAHAALGWYLETNNHLEEGRREILRAKALDPAGDHNLASDLIRHHEYDQAISLLKKRIEIDPSDGAAHFDLSNVYAYKGMEKESISEWQQTALLYEGKDAAEAIGRIYSKFGYRAARREVARQQEFYYRKGQFDRPVEIARTYCLLGDKEQALHWLEKAYEEHDGDLIFIFLDPPFEFLRSDPRFKDLMSRPGLPQL